MFTAPLWCLLFGTAICLAVQDDSSDAKDKELKEELGKAILKILGLKHVPKVPKGSRKKVPQFILDAYKKQFDESRRKDKEKTSIEDLSVRTTGNRDCSRRDFEVNFDEIYGDGNFVIHPTSYKAYYCQGGCPFPLSAHMNATNHAVIQTIANTVDSSSVPATCCVPTTLEPLHMLRYDDDNNVKFEIMEDMSVVGCGCR